jgi:hypothetical protein
MITRVLGNRMSCFGPWMPALPALPILRPIPQMSHRFPLGPMQCAPFRLHSPLRQAVVFRTRDGPLDPRTGSSRSRNTLSGLRHAVVHPGGFRVTAIVDAFVW